VYAQAVKSIASAIGRVRLDELDRPSARRLANAWPRNTSAVARTMWEDARRDGVCQENPWSNLRLRQSRGRKDIIALAEGEVQELADVAEMAHGEYGLEVRAMILVLAYTGVRPGELHVRRSLDVTGIEKLPKNGKQRVITVPPLALAAVSAMPRLLAADYIFHTVQGRRLSKSSLWYAWRPVRIAWRAAGHRDLDLYELRHAAATMLLERGVAHADVAVQLGHEDGGALVMSRYGHPSRDTARQRLKAAYRCEQQA
jgi:integrase